MTNPVILTDSDMYTLFPVLQLKNSTTTSYQSTFQSCMIHTYKLSFREWCGLILKLDKAQNVDIYCSDEWGFCLPSCNQLCNGPISILTYAVTSRWVNVQNFGGANNTGKLQCCRQIKFMQKSGGIRVPGYLVGMWSHLQLLCHDWTLYCIWPEFIHYCQKWRQQQIIMWDLQLNGRYMN